MTKTHLPVEILYIKKLINKKITKQMISYCMGRKLHKQSQRL